MNRALSARPPRSAPSRRGATRASPRSGLGGTLVGLFVGIALGLGLAAAVAYYLLKAGNPYQAAVTPSAREAAKDPVRPGKAEPPAADKPRFDFYKILPGNEEPRTPQKAAERLTGDKATAERAVTPDKAAARTEERPVAAPEKAAEKQAEKSAERAPKPSERYWLQAGSFASEGDAENLKAQLALSGLEASLQQATLPDRNVRYRVRLGPYDSADEMNRARADLVKRGFDVTAIRN